jgi:sulfatase modifying factor 1
VLVLLAAGCVGEPSARPDGGGVDVDGGGEVPDGGGGEGTGTWEEPIRIGSLPFQHAGDTTVAPADAFDAYACVPATDERGGEVVFVFDAAAPVQVRAAVDDVAGDEVDVDVHVLTAPLAEACTARDNVAVTVGLDTGRWYFAVDTWADARGDEKAGPFVFTVAEAGGSGGDCLTNPIVCEDGDAPVPASLPAEPPGVGGCPAGMTRIEDGAGFCIDRWEASLAEEVGGGELAPWSPYATPGTAAVRALSAPGVVPQGYITQVQATAACAAAGKRLCTDTEWLRACRGAGAQTYPYGATREDGWCNDARDCHPVVQFFESGADWVWSELGNSCINQLPDGLAETGAYPLCESDDGVFDMMGNLHEWTADPEGTFRGGFYVDTVINGEGCLYRTSAHDVSHWDYSTGFRCCAD